MLKKYPFYIKATVVLLGLVLFTIAIFNLRTVLIPVSFGLMLAILLNPFVSQLKKFKIPGTLAIAIAIIISLVILAGITYFLSKQLTSFSDQLPVFKQKIIELINKMQLWIYQKFNIDITKQNQLLDEAKTNMKPMIGETIGTMAGILEVIFLIPLYAFLFLFYKPLILNFLYEVFAEANSKEVGIVLTQTKGAIQHYMFGLLMEALIVATLNSIALIILGVKYAILLGVLGALVNVLPFIGGVIATALPLLIAVVTKDGFSTEIGIIISYVVIQFVDNHFLIPYIVSSRVKINALISILIVLLGGLVWGIPGMFLAIPFIGILKIIFDRVPELKPWGTLLGSEVPTKSKAQLWNTRRVRKISK